MCGYNNKNVELKSKIRPFENCVVLIVFKLTKDLKLVIFKAKQLESPQLELMRSIPTFKWYKII